MKPWMKLEKGKVVSYYSEYQRVLDKASDDIKEKMLSGKLTIKKACAYVDRAERKRAILERYSGRPITCTLKCVDFRKADVAANSIDAIITDPPYPKKFLPLYTDLARFADSTLIPGGHLICMSGHAHLPEVMKRLSDVLQYRWTISVILGGARTQGLGHRFLVSKGVRWKPVLIVSKKPVENSSIPTDVIFGSGEEKSGVYKEKTTEYGSGDWQQSVSEFRTIVEYATLPGMIICDPMMGTGTTGVAALSSGRSFIGMDNNPKLFRIAEKRLDRKWQ